MTSSLPLPILAPLQARRIAVLPARPRLSHASLLGVVGAHAALLSLLWLTPGAPEPVTPPRPLTVSLITPVPTEPLLAPQPQPESTPEPKPDPRSEPRPAPQPVAKPLTPPPVLVAERLQAAPQPVIETPRPVPQPEPVPEILPPPAPPAPSAPPTLAETAKPAPAPSPPAPLSPPRAADYLHNPKPPYPALSRRLGEEGIVRLNVLVNPDGSVARLEIARSSGHPRLDDAAARTVQTSWKFEPARQGGKPVQAWVIVPIHFILGS